ncbi:hypothetical protein D3C72_1574960 [compost metagenome]
MHGAIDIADKQHLAAAVFVSQLAHQAHHQGLRTHAVQVARCLAHAVRAVLALRALQAADAHAQGGALAAEEGKGDRIQHIVVIHQLQHHFAFAVHRMQRTQLQMVGRARLARHRAQAYGAVRRLAHQLAPALLQDEMVVLGQQFHALLAIQGQAQVRAVDLVDHVRIGLHQVMKYRMRVQQL